MPFSARSLDPIEMLLKNVGAFFPILALFFGWVASTIKKNKDKSAAASKSAPAGGDEAERTRKVQETIRRKIAERRAAIPPLDPFGGPGGRLRRLMDQPNVVPVRPVAVPPPMPDERALLDSEARLAAQVRQVQDVQQMAPAAVAAAPAGVLQPPVSPWLLELREPSGIRRAIILREILGAPVGLRQ